MENPKLGMASFLRFTKNASTQIGYENYYYHTTTFFTYRNRIYASCIGTGEWRDICTYSKSIYQEPIFVFFDYHSNITEIYLKSISFKSNLENHVPTKFPQMGTQFFNVMRSVYLNFGHLKQELTKIL